MRALQIVYVLLGAYGWWHWARGGADRGTLPVRRTTGTEWLGLAAAGVAGTGALWFFLAHYTDSTVPLPDALTTALSLLATYGQARKLVESWWLWITADLIYIPLYGYKGLWLTALLYVGFLCLWSGMRAWRRPSPAPPATRPRRRGGLMPAGSPTGWWSASSTRRTLGIIT